MSPRCPREFSRLSTSGPCWASVIFATTARFGMNRRCSIESLYRSMKRHPSFYHLSENVVLLFTCAVEICDGTSVALNVMMHASQRLKFMSLYDGFRRGPDLQESGIEPDVANTNTADSQLSFILLHHCLFCSALYYQLYVQGRKESHTVGK